jgi:hypothetical protein
MRPVECRVIFRLFHAKPPTACDKGMWRVNGRILFGFSVGGRFIAKLPAVTAVNTTNLF